MRAVHPAPVALRCAVMSYGNSPDSTGEGRAGQESQGEYGRLYWAPARSPQGYGAPPDHPGAQPQGYGAPLGSYGDEPPPTYLPWGIIAVVGGLLFCLIGGVPSGLASTHFARQVIPRWQAGDQQGAREASKKARTWAIVATVLDVLGLVFVIFYLLKSRNPAVG